MRTKIYCCFLFFVAVFVHAAAHAQCFEPVESYIAGTTPKSVVVFDYNGDGFKDIAASNAMTHNVSVLLGLGDGTFAPAVNYPAGLSPRSMGTADFNGDGFNDLATGNFDGNNISILFGDGTGAFAAPVQYAAGTAPMSVTPADYNGDGDIDIAVANVMSNEVSIFLNDGSGVFSGTNYLVGAGTNSRSTTAADFDEDGFLDLAVANYITENVSVMFGDGTGSFGAAVNFLAGSGTNYVTAADLNADGDMDIAAANLTSGDVSVLLGDGTGNFAAPVNYATGADAHAVEAADLNADGFLDLAVVNYGANNLSVLLGDGTGVFSAAVNYATGTNPLSIDAGDLNGDGYTDLAASNLGTHDVSVLLYLNLDPDLGSDVTVCDGSVILDAGNDEYNPTYLWSTGETTQTITASSTGTYWAKVSTPAGCVIASATDEIEVTVNTSTSSVTNITACDNYTWNGNTYSADGTYYDTIPNFAGCDSAMTLNLTINSTPGLATNLSGFTIGANQSGATYQWINCGTGAAIPGATSQTYTATADGDYAVVVTMSGCGDTSACVTISGLGLVSNDDNAFLVYPNPTTGIINIQLSDMPGDMVSIKIVNAIGEVVYSGQQAQSTFKVDFYNQPKGVYYVVLTTDDGTNVKKVVVE
jgi:hypothetical protein